MEYVTVRANCHLHANEFAAAVRWAEEKNIDVPNLLAVYGISGVRLQMLKYEQETPSVETLAYNPATGGDEQAVGEGGKMKNVKLKVGTRCECPEEGIVPASNRWMYAPEEFSGMNHAPGKCPCTNHLRMYRRGEQYLTLCSCCCLSGEIEVDTEGCAS